MYGRPSKSHRFVYISDVSLEKYRWVLCPWIERQPCNIRFISRSFLFIYKTSASVTLSLSSSLPLSYSLFPLCHLPLSLCIHFTFLFLLVSEVLATWVKRFHKLINIYVVIKQIKYTGKTHCLESSKFDCLHYSQILYVGNVRHWECKACKKTHAKNAYLWNKWS